MSLFTLNKEYLSQITVNLYRPCEPFNRHAYLAGELVWLSLQHKFVVAVRCSAFIKCFRYLCRLTCSFACISFVLASGTALYMSFVHFVHVLRLMCVVGGDWLSIAMGNK